MPFDAGLSEIARFLAPHPPFDSLAPGELGELARHAEIEFYAARAPILTEEGGPVTYLRVIHSGGVDISHEGRLLDLLGPGDAFGHAAMLSGLPPGFEARAAEDTLCYRIPVAAARPLLERARTRDLQVSGTPLVNQPVAKLVRSATVICDPGERIRDVARRMTETGASCAIVDARARGQGYGIVTDRDLRIKVIAGEAPLDGGVASVMTAPIFSVTPGRLGGEVLFEMLDRDIRHAPVISERGEVIGVVEDHDLLGMQPRTWFGTRRQIAAAKTLDALAEVAARLPELVVELHDSELRASEVARVLSVLVDAVTIRALELVEPAFELPADGLVWVAVGSQARRELTPASTVRGAVVCSDSPPPGWSDAVAAALARCGQTGEVSVRDTDSWERATDDELGLSMLIERRALWGTPRDPLPTVEEPVRTEILAALARRAHLFTPPTGFDGDAVLGADGRRSEMFDIRQGAVAPIVEVARWAGATAGTLEGSTPDRLRAARAAGVLSEADASTLIDAFELVLELRIGHHAEQLAAGREPDDNLAPAAMSPLMRSYLRDAFRSVVAVQRKLGG